MEYALVLRSLSLLAIVINDWQFPKNVDNWRRIGFRKMDATPIIHATNYPQEDRSAHVQTAKRGGLP
jgi:hypothetical protein